MKTQKIALWIALTALPISGFSASEKEHQESRMPHKISQKEAKKLLTTLKQSVEGKNANPKALSSFVTGVKSQGDIQNQGDEDALIKQQCFADESEFLNIQSTLVKSWTDSWMKKDAQSFQKLLAKDATIHSFNNSNKAKKIDTFHYSKWDHVKKYSKNKLILKDLKKYFSGFSKIEDLDLVTKRFKVPVKTRAKDLQMKFLEAEVRFDLRGFEGKTRRHDRGYLAVRMERNSVSAGDWKISGIDILKMETLTSRKPAFAEITKISGVNNIPSYNRIEAIRRGGYAMASGDYDGDGINDLYIGAYGPAKLLKGSKDGTYKVAEGTGIGDHLYVKAAVWADFNNDSMQDLLIVRFVPNKDLTGMRNTDLLVYQNMGNGKFKSAGKILEESGTDYAMPAAVADFNNDGLLDFYVGYPGHKDFSTFKADFEFKKKLKAQGVYINQGQFKFKPEAMSADASKSYEKYSEAQQIFPHSSVAIDFNQDGNVDILVIDDRGNLSPAYVNTGNGKFIQNNQEFEIENYDYGMGIASGDVNNDGLIDLFMTNVRFNAKNRIIESCQINWETPVLGEGMFKNRRDIKAFIATKLGNKKKFVESAKALGLDEMGDGLAGMEFIDYNNDGHLDLYVANGLWSGTSKYDDLSSYFARGEEATEHIFRENRSATQSSFMDILSNYKGDISGDTKVPYRLSLGGFERNRLFRNNGDGTFMEVGFIEGADSIADGYILSKVDIDNDGRIDLILRNGDPGTDEMNFAPVQVFKNNHPNLNSLRVKLVGSNGNRDAIGAEVEVKISDSNVQTQQMIANNGTAQSEKVLHFGLGKAKMVKSVTVKWPQGKHSIFRNIKPGLLLLKEGDGIESEKKGISLNK